MFCFIPLANAHAAPVRFGIVLGKDALHLMPAPIVQHAQREKYPVARVTRKKSGDKCGLIGMNEILQHLSVIIVGEIDIMKLYQHSLR